MNNAKGTQERQYLFNAAEHIPLTVHPAERKADDDQQQVGEAAIPGIGCVIGDAIMGVNRSGQGHTG